MFVILILILAFSLFVSISSILNFVITKLPLVIINCGSGYCWQFNRFIHSFISSSVSIFILYFVFLQRLSQNSLNSLLLNTLLFLTASAFLAFVGFCGAISPVSTYSCCNRSEERRVGKEC